MFARNSPFDSSPSSRFSSPAVAFISSLASSLRAHQAWLAIVTGVATGIGLVLLAARTSPTVAAAAFVGLFIVAIVLTFPTLGLLLTAFVIPIERLGRLTSDSSMYTVSLMRIVGIVALGGFVFHTATRRRNIHFGKAFFIYLAYSVVGFITVFYTTDKLGGVRACGAILGNLLFFFLIVNLARTWKLARLCVLVWLLASVCAGVYTIYAWHFGNNGEVNELQVGEGDDRFNTVMNDSSEYDSLGQVERAVGTTSHSAVYGINLILTLPFFAYLFRTTRNMQAKFLTLAACGIIFYNILLTNTRATIIIALAVIALCFLRGLLKVNPLQILCAALLGCCLLYVVPDAIYRRVLDASNYTLQRSGTLRARLDYYQAGLQIARENWLTGIGIGNQSTVPKYLNKLSTTETSVHNDYLNTFLEVGLFGWMLFFGFVAFVFRCSIKTSGILRRFGEDKARSASERRMWAERYWFVAACQMAMLSVLIYCVQVDVFHFPLKGWWLIAALSQMMYTLASQEAGGRSTSPEKTA